MEFKLAFVLGVLCISSAVALLDTRRRVKDEVQIQEEAEVLPDEGIEILGDTLFDNGRGQIPEGPDRNCSILEKQFGVSWKTIRLPHEYDCTRFYECDDQVLIEKACADRYRTRYDPFQKLCEWNSIIKCINYVEYLEILGKSPAGGNSGGCS
jgi:hypothetical protein